MLSISPKIPPIGKNSSKADSRESTEQPLSLRKKIAEEIAVKMN